VKRGREAAAPGPGHASAHARPTDREMQGELEKALSFKEPDTSYLISIIKLDRSVSTDI
jgi:hypothetical protein